jgi:hypothetical protein
MTTGTRQKRLDRIEVQLTPKEWAIRMAQEIRQLPSGLAYARALAEGYVQDLKSKAYCALRQQAEERHPGKRPENISACTKYKRNLHMELHALEMLMAQVNEAISVKADNAMLEVALNLAKLHALILQDAFGRTAGKAAQWAEAHKPSSGREERVRHELIKELYNYCDADGRLPWLIESCRQDMIAPFADIFHYQAAVQMVQDKCFDGHPILWQDVEAGLVEAIKILEDGVAIFNDYLSIGERKGISVIDIDAIRSRQDGSELANQWIKIAKYYGILGYLEGQELDAFVRDALREMSGVRP